jgi:hypothetical protein
MSRAHMQLGNTLEDSGSNTGQRGWTREDQETRVAHGVTSGLKINRRWASAKGYFGAQNTLNNDF